MDSSVVILSYCRKMELCYGTALVFKTLRVGFPNARVTVVDNVSLPEAAAEIEKLARETECRFERVPAPGIQHHEFLEARLKEEAAANGAGPLIFLDPDICFWRSCEDFDFDALLAGKVVRTHYVQAIRTTTLPRIHTSFMWIPDARRLWQEIVRIRSEHFDFHPFSPFSVQLAGQWFRFDTGASLYSVIHAQTAAFTEAHLDCFDHLYAGCHLDWVFPALGDGLRTLIMKSHEDARAGNLAALKGIWRSQARACQVETAPDSSSTGKEGTWKM
jgi:hypothetical protein